MTRKELKHLFSFLEKRMGGDGNGVATLPNFEIVKGVKLSAYFCADMTYRALQENQAVVFHTRLRSSGPVCDSLCHPFYTEGKKWKGIIAHNGHWFGGDALVKLHALKRPKDVVSDSSLLATIVSQYGLEKINKVDLVSSGIWLVCDEKTHTVWCKSGDLEYDIMRGVWSSEFPFKWGRWTYPVEFGNYDLQTATPLERKKTKWDFHETYEEETKHLSKVASE